MYVYICIHVWTHMKSMCIDDVYVYMCICVRLSMLTSIYPHAGVSMYYTCICIYLLIYIRFRYLCICIYTYLYISILKDIFIYARIILNCTHSPRTHMLRVMNHTCLPAKSSDRTMKSMLQHTATYCNTLQHTATNCTTLPQMVVLSTPKESLWNALQHSATHYSTLQYTGSFERTTKFTLHHAATHCNKQDVQSAPQHTIKTWLMNVEMYKAEVMPCGVQQKRRLIFKRSLMFCIQTRRILQIKTTQCCNTLRVL